MVPSCAVPVLTTNPLGWAVLGVAGYLTYRAGKRSALKQDAALDRPSLGDRAVKGAMKTVYRAKMQVDESLSKTREKYAGMWQEAKADISEDQA
jgi:hypothetical protein